jgi:hypothetical protein
VGRHVACLYAEDDVAAGIPGRDLARAARRGRAEAEGIRVRQGGERFHARVVVTGIVGDEGQIAGFAVLVRDCDRMAS